MTGSDIRWLQRFDNFQRALLVLERGVQLAQTRELSELEQQGLIKGFEFTHELAWNLLKDYLGIPEKARSIVPQLVSAIDSR